MEPKTKTASAEFINKVLGARPVISDVKSAAETGKVQVPGAQPATSGATAVNLPSSVNKVVLRTRARGTREWVVDHETDITARIENFTFAPWNGMASLRDLLNNGYRFADETVAVVNNAPHRRVFYQRCMARVEVRFPEVDGVTPEPYIEDGTYKDGDQVISRDPMGLFSALNVSDVQQDEKCYYLNIPDFGPARVTKVRVGDVYLNHVRTREVMLAVNSGGGNQLW